MTTTEFPNKRLEQEASLSPIFIVGCPRSGTTLLQAKLSSLDMVAIPPEDDFILRFYLRLNGDIKSTLSEQQILLLIDDLFSHDNNTFRHWKINREQIENYLAALEQRITLPVLIDSIYRTFLSRFDNKSLWGCKVPYFAAHINLLHRIFPNAKFIHLVRDGRANVQSMLERNKMVGVRHFSRSTMVCAWQWLKLVSSADKQGQNFSHSYIVIYFENLLSDTSTNENKILEFLAIENAAFSEDYFARMKENNLLRDDNIELYVKPKLDNSKANRWRQLLTNKQVYVIEKIAEHTLKEHHYDIIGPDLTLFDKVFLSTKVNFFVGYQQLKMKVKSILNIGY